MLFAMQVMEGVIVRVIIATIGLRMWQGNWVGILLSIGFVPAYLDELNQHLI